MALFALAWLVTGAVLAGLFSDDLDSAVGYLVTVTLWPLIAVTVAVQMIRERF